MTCGAERRLHGPQRPSTLGWLLYFAQRPVGRIASMPVTGQERPFEEQAESSHSTSLAAEIAHSSFSPDRDIRPGVDSLQLLIVA